MMELLVLAGCDKSLTRFNDGYGKIKCSFSIYLWRFYTSWKYKGKDLTIIDVFEAVGKHASGEIDEKELKNIEKVACPTAGSCGGQFTANTMACISEAIGLL